MGSGLTVANNEMECIIELITSLKRGILLKGTTKKIINQKGEFLDNVLGPLTKSRLPLMKNILTPSSKHVLASLALTTAASATEAAIQTKPHRSGMTTQTVSNDEMKDVMDIVKSFEESGLLIKVLAKQLKMKQRTK